MPVSTRAKRQKVLHSIGHSIGPLLDGANDRDDSTVLSHVLGYIATPELARMRLVKKQWKVVVEKVFEERKKKFETKQELGEAVVAYCGNDRQAKIEVQCMYDVHIGDWDVSQLTDLSGVFEGMGVFNEPIQGWDVSTVTNMCRMFYGAWSFNQPLNGWNTSQVTNMSRMFERAYSFNQPLNGWDTSQVTTMMGVFYDASSFNQPLDGWNVSNVTNMSEMFRSAS